MGNWKPALLTEGKYYLNGLTFATQEEARQIAESTFQEWTEADGFKVVEVHEIFNPVTAKIEDGVLVIFK